MAGANRNDLKMAEATLENRPIRPRRGTSRHMCLDPRYDCSESRDILEAHDFVAQVRARGEGQKQMERNSMR